jgi:hypothetical protein
MSCTCVKYIYAYIQGVKLQDSRTLPYYNIPNGSVVRFDLMPGKMMDILCILYMILWYDLYVRIILI